MSEYTLINKCPISNTTDKITYFDLGKMPLVNNLCDTEYDSLNCKRYSLKLNYFQFSGLSALSHSVNGDLLFSKYLFKSEINTPYISHSKQMLEYIEHIVELNTGDLIVDIGGNDGTLLSTFKTNTDKSLNYLNIDPSQNLAKLSIDKEIPVLTDFFSIETAKAMAQKVKVIVSTNVFQHLKDINSFVEGICTLLDEDGIWVLEFPYWAHDLETKQFDQIYHEHVYYYMVTSLSKMMDKHELDIIRITPQKIHGGTLRLVMAKKTSNHISDGLVQQYINIESKYDIEYYKNWGDSITTHLNKCKGIISDIKKSGKSIVVFGAAAKGCIFLNSLNLTYKDIDYIIDDTDIKQGKYMPGTGLEIVSRDSVNLDDIDYMIILPHNFSEYIIESFKDTYKGRFVTFLPTIEVI
jgi:hypothetical protein